ncbi:MAG: efflux RND transporter permease subunit [Phycisphaerales bacterium]|nr:MAG: efflux RND transporter permease subunit [Phycisphaerales bacterium]
MTSLPRLSVDNPVLVNLFLVTILVGGTICGFSLVREMFPESTPNQVIITTVYPGATPAEVEKGISVKIEEAIKNIEEIEEIKTSISEGLSMVTAVLYNDVDDVDQIVTDIKAAIDTIPRDDFPEEAEENFVAKFEPKLPVINVAYFGDLDEKKLKAVGRKLRDDLLLIPGITDVFLGGTRNDEISVEVSPERLIEYGLSFPEVGQAIARANLDLPGGQIKTAKANVSVRTLGEKDQAEPIGEIIVRSDVTGKVIRLQDVATVIDGFEDADITSRFKAKPAVNLTVYKTASQDAIEISNKVKAFVAGKSRQPLQRDWLARTKLRLGIRDDVEQIYQAAYNDPVPPEGSMQTSTNLARFIEGRLDLLKRNGRWGLILVFCSLLLFLNWRVALWVMIGLLLAILGTLIVMKVLGLTLNLISMFGMIVVLGLLVDDAIIVGEHVFFHVENGMEPKRAAVVGAEAVTWPVVCAIITTIVAFAPLVFIEGRMGDFMGVLPIIVMCALSVSLFEALSILPSHLAQSLKPANEARQTHVRTSVQHFSARLRAIQAHFLRDRLMDGYEKLLRKAVSYRYVTVATLCAVLLIALGAVFGGRVPIVFIQKMDSETLLAGLKMPVGTPIERTDQAVSAIEQAAVGLPELQSMYAVMGAQYATDGGADGIATHLGQVIIELEPIDQRERTSEDILRELRAQCRDIPGVNSLKFNAMHGGPGGAAIQIEISSDNLDHLLAAADHYKKELGDYAGVFDVDDDFDAGRREVQIELLDSARALGLTTQSLATQVRAAFYGLEARKIQRDREDVKIMVRYPPEYRRHVYQIESMRIAAPDGTLVPFREIARLTEGSSYASIKRKDQKRTITIMADVDESRGNAREINAALAASFPQIEARYPGMKIALGGQTREFIKSFGSLKKDFLIAVMLIYVILAGLFKNYVQPLIVMAAIPFGVVGVVVGHHVMGFPITILSLIGLVALTGIVVNDSLILVDFINRRRKEGIEDIEAVVMGGRSRLRAIILTSITTILGLAPLLMETSFQARFLIPMGISIAFGLAFATVLTLVGVPSLYIIALDCKRTLRTLLNGLLPTPAPANPDA